MSTIERSEERDAALAALLPQVAEHGWTTKALRLGLADTGADPDTASWLFAGPTDMVEAYIDWADRRMEAGASALSQTRVSQRVRALIALRFAQAAGERVAVRRAAAVLAVPTNAAAGTRSLARTVDAIWHAAGDESADFSWYSKRAILAAVYSTTLLYWLRHDAWSDPEDALTLGFLDRRLAGVARLGKLRGRIDAARARLRPGWTRAPSEAAPMAPALD
jgi:ubiquinone biosynthesis protein COQ9